MKSHYNLRETDSYCLLKLAFFYKCGKLPRFSAFCSYHRCWQWIISISQHYRQQTKSRIFRHVLNENDFKCRHFESIRATSYLIQFDLSIARSNLDRRSKLKIIVSEFQYLNIAFGSTYAIQRLSWKLLSETGPPVSA